MRKLYPILFIFAGLLPVCAFGQLFVQDFSSSTNVNDYVSASPDNTQFTYIGTSGSGVTFSINNGTLEMVRGSGNAGYVCRNADFSPAPSLLKVTFDLEIPTASTAALNASIFRFGQSYGNDNNTPPNSNTHSRIGINMVGGEGFQLRDIGAGANSATFNGVQTVTWWINNSGSGATYTGPDGSTNTVADDKNDVWAGNTLVFDETAAVTPSVAITDFKLFFEFGSGTIRFDNFLMTTETSLPVGLSRFVTEKTGSATQISWSTASETNNDYFAVERSADGRIFSEIGRVNGSGTTREARHYSYTDRQPLHGLNYYRLKQVDFDAGFAFSPVRTVLFDQTAALRIGPSPANDILHLFWESPATEPVRWAIFDTAGRQALSGECPADNTAAEITVGTLPPGAYVFRANGTQHAETRFFLKQ